MSQPGDRGQYLRAAGDGLKCLPLLNKSRSMEPTNKDILFGQGIYNYFAEVMPRQHQWLRLMMAQNRRESRAALWADC